MIILIMLFVLAALPVGAYITYELMYMRTLEDEGVCDEYTYDGDVRAQYMVDKRNGGYMR